MTEEADVPLYCWGWTCHLQGQFKGRMPFKVSKGLERWLSGKNACHTAWGLELAHLAHLEAKQVRQPAWNSSTQEEEMDPWGKLAN